MPWDGADRLRISLGIVGAAREHAVFGQGPGGYTPPGQGVDLSENWGPVFHEDSHERGPGPELVNYLGIPITEAARA